MGKKLGIYAALVMGCALLLVSVPAKAQLGNSGSIEGVIKDPTGAVLAGVNIEISFPVTGYKRQTTTGSDGSFRFTNVPFNPYHMVVSATGFGPYTHDVEVRSTVPVRLEIGLKVARVEQKVMVEAKGEDLIEKDSTFHTDVDKALTDRLPIESQTSALSSLVVLVAPGFAADSNGLTHGMGDHAENSFAVDNQPISDQQSKVFSNQTPVDAVQSLEVLSGAPPAEFGDKTSVVIKVTTRSGLGVTKPTGRVYSSYGSFGTGVVGLNLAYGGPEMGQLHRREWPADQPISRSAGTPRFSRQRKRREPFRPGGFSG
ncbi:MAG TPA: carboxypeptidase-like regulatory domain-containing protein [Candidatus Acidoferrales bacterium]|nr:carboxypeptidase-like regulatory domain-containing protein [Candidatus Acidoferrales bacterium]